MQWLSVHRSGQPACFAILVLSVLLRLCNGFMVLRVRTVGWSLRLVPRLESTRQARFH